MKIRMTPLEWAQLFAVCVLFLGCLPVLVVLAGLARARRRWFVSREESHL